MNIYERDRLRSEYLLFHFGTPAQVLPWSNGPAQALDFPARIVDRFSRRSGGRALDLGCAVGRSSFELSRTADEVVAIDYSRSFIEAARQIQRAGHVAIDRLEEGHRSERISVLLPPGARPARVHFEQGDAMNLRADLGRFEQVLAANLLCRLAQPALLLERLPQLVAPDGELILTTPCTWLEDFTPPGHWPPGATREWLVERLGPAFELVGEYDEPFLIRETARKFQWTVALLTKWRRRSH